MRIRKPLIAANWKMNVLPSEAFHLADHINSLTKDLNVDIVVAPPFTHLAFLKPLYGGNFSLGAQDVHSSPMGAHTGGVSVAMLKDLGVEYIIVGHSERRAEYESENALIRKKIDVCINAGLKVVYCCGESMELRELGKAFEFVQSQLENDLGKMEELNSLQIVIAYEPIWAIGTGLNASPQQADEMHLFIRQWLRDKFSLKAAESTRILYGGSVNATNAQELAAQINIDGALVGGASLKPDLFAEIAKAWHLKIV
ncbi:MAG: triose-phosphate isomerase [Saprospiraceae bacterium]